MDDDEYLSCASWQLKLSTNSLTSELSLAKLNSSSTEVTKLQAIIIFSKLISL